MDGTAFGSPITVASGAASINLIGLSVKTHTISAAYSGDGNYAAATASESITVTAAAATSKVQLSSTVNPATSSKPVSFVAMVVTKTGQEPWGTVKLHRRQGDAGASVAEEWDCEFHGHKAVCRYARCLRSIQRRQRAHASKFNSLQAGGQVVLLGVHWTLGPDRGAPWAL